MDKIKGDIAHSESMIQRDNELITRYTAMHKERTQEIERLQAAIPQHSKKLLTADNLSKLGMAQNLKSTDADTYSEFTEMTGDTEIGMLDNILDLKISSIDFEQAAINKALGMKGALPNAV